MSIETTHIQSRYIGIRLVVKSRNLKSRVYWVRRGTMCSVATLSEIRTVWLSGKYRDTLEPMPRPTRAQVSARLESAIDEVRERLGGLPTPLEAQGVWTTIWYEEAHHSTAVEGNTLVLKQVETLLAEGRAVGDKQLSEYMEVRGYADAAQWVYSHRPAAGEWSTGDILNLTEVRQVHRMTMQPAWDVSPHPGATDNESPGSFREHEIAPFPSGMTPPSWVEVPATMADWLASIGSVRTAERPIETLAAAHGRFERIHPFLDGNGRTGRLLLNLMLVRLGYPPAIVYKRDRPRYLAALQRADAGDAGALGELLARSILDNLYRFVVPAIAGPSRLVPLASLATPTLTTGALRVAANRGRLRAQHGSDGQWRSTQQWVDDYVRGRYRRN
jgi:Fic family protein